MSSLNTNRLRSNLCKLILEYMHAQQLGKGDHLTTSALASQFHVSRTPVHSALVILQERGFLDSRQNRGFFVKKPIKSQSDIPREFQQTEEDRLYMEIADDRLRSVLPDRVTEVELLRRYDTTRGILSRVLRTLSSEGLATNLQGHGWEFNTVLNSRESYAQSYNFRKIIEPSGILEDTFELDPEKARGIRQQHQGLMRAKKVSAAQIFEVNSNFHAVIASFSQNSFIEEAVRKQNRLRRFVEYGYHWDDPEKVRAACIEHLTILDAIESGDRKRAANLMWQHLDAASQIQDNNSTDKPQTWADRLT